MDALPRCVGCGEPTTSRTDDGRPKHVGCPDSPWSLTSAIGGAWTAEEADAIARAYAAGHRDGLVCGAESAGFGLVECEHVGRFALRPAVTQTVATSPSIMEMAAKVRGRQVAHGKRSGPRRGGFMPFGDERTPGEPAFDPGPRGSETFVTDIDRLPAGLELENLLADWPHTINIEPRRAYLRQVAAHVLDVLREMGVSP